MPHHRTLILIAALFPTHYAWPLEIVNYGAASRTAQYSVASELDIFSSFGIEVDFEQYPNSTYGNAQLLAGGFDVVSGNIDNPINQRFNNKKAVTIVGQLDFASDLVIASIPSITSVLELKGKQIIVDSPTSGTTYILRKVLGLYGLHLENGDYWLQTVGSTNVRYQYLIDGVLPNGTAVYASMLTYPFTAITQAVSGANKPSILVRVSDLMQPLSGMALSVLESSLSNATAFDTLTRFFASFLSAQKILLSSNPECKQASITAISRSLNISSEVAEAEYLSSTDPYTGIGGGAGSLDLSFSKPGLINIIGARIDAGGFAGVGPGFNFVDGIESGTGKLVDYTLRDAALKRASSLDWEEKCSRFPL